MSNRVKTYVDPDDIFGADINRQQDLAVVEQELSYADVSWTTEGGNVFRGVFSGIPTGGADVLDAHTNIEGTAAFNWNNRYLKITYLEYAAAARLPGGVDADLGPTNVFEGTFFTGTGGSWPLGAGDFYIEIAPDVYIYVPSGIAPPPRLWIYNGTGGFIYFALIIEASPVKV